MALNKYKRTNFYVQEEIDDILEYDLVNNYWDLFRVKRPTSSFTVGRTYIARPDLLSIKVYGRQDYWYFLCKYNNIDDVWNDITVGMTINVLDVRDIEDWISEVKKVKK